MFSCKLLNFPGILLIVNCPQPIFYFLSYLFYFIFCLLHLSCEACSEIKHISPSELYWVIYLEKL